MPKVLNVRDPHVHALIIAGKAIYIGRGAGRYQRSEWANPFPISGIHNRTYVIERYRRWLYDKLRDTEVQQRLLELDEQDLACHCAPFKCHGEVLINAIKYLKSAID